MTYHSETDIIEACLKSDRVAQKALYDQFKTRMYTLAYRITGNFDDANDVLQDGFLQVFRKLHTFKGDSKLGSWIHTIMARTAIDRIKHRIFFEDVEKIDTSTPIDWGTSIVIDYLEKAIANLPEGYRTIFTLYEIEGFKHREIAELMDISESTSKSQLFKAKKMLRENLEKLIN
ncbi:MAG: RNA polymerase sigma factor [Bacteroidales bacterium]|jgi:RNA polymerase sigma-70 factor (ECF subfamily)|nr:RNA polymerase sigma factor [Bacteroidales bacterium]MDD4177619.1 RNA polymerase sigma factor [Bacteroidales bacterium]MDD4741955.1 RNA polymerase sigma factor [Bacteroidales bacterium]NLO52032.1 RNA polymerase sigma factor [Bacteroidales bacterium]